MPRQMQRKNIVKVAGVGAIAAVIVGAGLQLASAAENEGGAAGAVSVSCPGVADKLGAVPAAAQAGVNDELQNLDKQIANVNARLAREPKAAANQLNDIAGKRRAVLDRISQNITRVGGAAPAGLQALANCSLNGAAGDAGGNNEGAAGNNEGNVNAGEGQVGNVPANAKTVNCPSVEDKLPAVPAGAAGQVSRELANLEKEITEANARLAKIAAKPEGGPNFIQNAILGPLQNKRVAVLNRIATDIGRITKDRPVGLDSLAPCTLNN